MPVKFTNNATSTILNSISNVATTITLESGEGALFPSLSSGEYFYGTLADGNDNLEIVKVTARTSDTLTVVRGQDNTTARAYTAGDRFELRPVAAALSDLAGGATGAGSDDVFYENGQTVTGSYTITSGKNAGTFGPVTINSGVTVTVPSGSTWTLV